MCALVFIIAGLAGDFHRGPAFIWTGFVITAVLVGLASFVFTGMRVTVDVNQENDACKIFAPAYSTTFSLSLIQQADVAEDSGTNSGLINWPVIGRAAGANGVRINIGGHAHVSIRLSDGRTYVVVVPSLDEARAIASALKTNAPSRSHLPDGQTI